MVTTREQLNDAMRKSITRVLSEAMGKDIIIEEKRDEEILGGIVIKVGDFIMDGSLAKDLKELKNNLLDRKIRSEVAYED
jgi:F-type H+-transporting ATPase subunit delta